MTDSSLPAVALELVAQTERTLERADTKAFSLSAGAAAAMVIPAQQLISGVDGAAQWLLLSGVIGWCAGIAVLMLAVYPRFIRSDSTLYFGELAECGAISEARCRLQMVESDPERWLLAQSIGLGRIAMRKYQLIRTGMVLMGASAGLALFGLVMQ